MFFFIFGTIIITVSMWALVSYLRRRRGYSLFLFSSAKTLLALLVVCLVSIPFIFVAPNAYADQFGLDPTFGTGGHVQTSFGFDAEDSAVAEQSDGKIVVGGLASNGNYY